MTIKSDIEFLREAIQVAKDGMALKEGGPFGALVVHHGKIISRGFNQVTSSNDPTAHAEIVAIRQACEYLRDFQLTDCVLYTTCEPCPMCLGAIYWSRLSRFVYACDRKDAAQAAFDDAFIYDEIHTPPLDRSISGTQLLQKEGRELFRIWGQMERKIEY